MPRTVFEFLGQIALVAAWGWTIILLLRRDRQQWPVAVVALAAATLLAGRPFLHPLASLLEAAALVVALIVIASDRREDKSAGSTTILVDALPGLRGASLRHLEEQGVWVSGKVGEQLVTQGKPVDSLYLMCGGASDVTVDGVKVGSCGPRQFIGELTVLSGEPATASVTLTELSRLWCISASAMRDAARLHDDVRNAMNEAVRRSLTEKLIAANKAQVAN